MKRNGIKHILCSPYYPSSNDLAERFVHTFKRAMKAGKEDRGNLNHSLAEFLFDYRSAAHATTNVSPSELFLNRKLHTRFDLLKPNLQSFVTSKQADQKSHHDSHSKLRYLFPGQPVMVKDFRYHNKWIPGTIVWKLEPVTYSVEVGNGNIIKRHIDHLTQRNTPSPQPATHGTIQNDFQYPDINVPRPSGKDPESTACRHYPQRVRRPPDRFMLVL